MLLSGPARVWGKALQRHPQALALGHDMSSLCPCLLPWQISSSANILHPRLEMDALTAPHFSLHVTPCHQAS